MDVAGIQKQCKPTDLSRGQLRARLEKLPATASNAGGTRLSHHSMWALLLDGPLQ
jgi:hypothetical protein